MPVRNEEAELPILLSALQRQTGGMPFSLCVYLDNCTDNSNGVIGDFAQRTGLPVFIGRSDANDSSNAGRARGAAMALGLRKVGADRGALLLTTDADSAPEPDWIVRSASSLAEVEVAAGRIIRRDAAGPSLASRLEDYLDRLYALRRRVDPVVWELPDTHHFGGGANLAIRASEYISLGGFAPLVAGEDARLLDDASRAGLRVRRDPRMVVVTSARRSGRVPGGLAAVLRDLDRGIEPMVGDPVAALWQYRMQAEARRVFHQSGAATEFGRKIGLSEDHVRGVARDCPNAEAFAMRIVPAPPGAQQSVPLPEAERRLAAMETMTVDEAA
ncbi:glycosyltransferase [uncultured Sphingomonas sp.]|uniref:glycosyltransferase n=1 Tax=uncultured Sphingomonas sp. TaxID=158754 RepID=UPI0035CA8837